MVEIEARSIRPRSRERRDHLVLAPRDLQVAVDLDPVERRPGEGVERLVEGERLAAGRRRPSRGRPGAAAAPAATGPAAARRQSPSGNSERGRSTSSSIISTPAATAASKLSRVFPGRIESAPLWPIRFKRRTVAPCYGRKEVRRQGGTNGRLTPFRKRLLVSVSAALTVTTVLVATRRRSAPPTVDRAFAAPARPNVVVIESDDQTVESMRVMDNVISLIGETRA